MTTRRKDSQNRVLHDGESQRKDGRYQYRFTDNLGRRKTIYGKTLNDLRKKEQEIFQCESDRRSYSEGRMSVVDASKLVMLSKKNIRKRTEYLYHWTISKLAESPIGDLPIADLRPTDLKLFLIKMRENGYAYSTVKQTACMIHALLQECYNDDIIRKNPANFRVSSILPDDTSKRQPLTPLQQKNLFAFSKTDQVGKRIYDVMVILLGTGIRIGELCGLTRDNVDMKKRVIHIKQQLHKRHGWEVSPPKSGAGVRSIPMTQTVYESMQRVIAKSFQADTSNIAEGQAGFIFLTNRGAPCQPEMISRPLQTLANRYNNAHPNEPPLRLSPHIFRHTFCTNMANAGMDVKTLQYIMGHSSVSVTMDVYSHIELTHVEEQMNEYGGRLSETV